MTNPRTKNTPVDEQTMLNKARLQLAEGRFREARGMLTGYAVKAARAGDFGPAVKARLFIADEIDRPRELFDDALEQLWAALRLCSRAADPACAVRADDIRAAIRATEAERALRPHKALPDLWSGLYQEVKALFLVSDRFLRGFDGGPPRGCLLEPAFERADLLARSQDPGNGFEDWVGLRERQAGATEAAARAADLDLKLFDSDWNDYDRLDHRFGEQMLQVYDEVIADMEMIARARLVSGTGNAFFETMFAVYEAGGWPCGWQGEYPQGRMVVYDPAADAGRAP